MYVLCMQRKFEDEGSGELENCYLVDGVYLPDSEYQKHLDARYRRSPLGEWTLGIATALLFTVLASYALQEFELIKPPRSPDRRSELRASDGKGHYLQLDPTMTRWVPCGVGPSDLEPCRSQFLPSPSAAR